MSRNDLGLPFLKLASEPDAGEDVEDDTEGEELEDMWAELEDVWAGRGDGTRGEGGGGGKDFIWLAAAMRILDGRLLLESSGHRSGLHSDLSVFKN